MSAPTVVTIRPTKPAGNPLQFELVGDDDLSGGIGGWQELPRPRREAAVEWTGTPSTTYTLPLLLDGLETSVGSDTVIEAACRQVEAWGVKTKKTGQPPVLRVSGPVRVPAASRWVVNGITWGQLVRNADGRRIQQYLTLTLLKYVEAEIVRSPAKRARLGVGHD